MTIPLLKIAVPNKGSLAEGATTFLKECGYRQRVDSKDLSLVDIENEVEFYYLRPRDIAVYVGSGKLDLGITGRDMLLDSGAAAEEVMTLGFGTSKFRFAAPKQSIERLVDLNGKRIATSYPGLLKDYLAKHEIQAQLIKLDGAVESAVRLGVAEVIADVVDTGTTLAKAELELFGEPILQSEAVLIKRQGSELADIAQNLMRRLSGLLVAHNYVMLEYDVAEENLKTVCKIAPGLESPTVSSLVTSGWYAVRTMVPRKDAHHLMDELWQAGARAILLTELAACRI